MTKDDLIRKVWNKKIKVVNPGIWERKTLSYGKCEEAVNAVLEGMKQALRDHDKVTIRTFGEFTVKHKNERMGHNPKNGAPAVISERSVVKFKASPILKEKINRR